MLPETVWQLSCLISFAGLGVHIAIGPEFLVQPGAGADLFLVGLTEMGAVAAFGSFTEGGARFCIDHDEAAGSAAEPFKGEIGRAHV